MCLFTNEFSKIAENDIACYKVVKECVSFTLDGKAFIYYASPMRPFNWELNRVFETEGCWWFYYNKDHSIGNGYFHTFVNLGNAMDLYYKLNNYCYGTYVIVKAIIPKGTEYYCGTDINDAPNYASKKLMLVKKVNFT